MGIVALLATSQSVSAENSAPACSDDISARCILAHPESPFVQGYVQGFTHGIFRLVNGETVDGITYDVLRFSLSQKACLPINLPLRPEALFELMRGYLSAKLPDQENWPFADVLSMALSQTYPCPSSLGR